MSRKDNHHKADRSGEFLAYLQVRRSELEAAIAEVQAERQALIAQDKALIEELLSLQGGLIELNKLEERFFFKGVPIDTLVSSGQRAKLARPNNHKEQEPSPVPS